MHQNPSFSGVFVNAALFLPFPFVTLIPLNLKKKKNWKVYRKIAPPVCLGIISAAAQCLTSPCAPFPECSSTEAWPWRRSSVLDLIWITLLQVSFFQALLNHLQPQRPKRNRNETGSATHILLFSLAEVTQF